MITVLARLGLRAGETTVLLVSDIDWRRGEFLVRGKANRIARLLLPVDAGEAVVAWMEHGRPDGGCGHVFTRLRAPVGPLSNGDVSMVVSRACQRAGPPVMHAHRLCHTVATETLRARGSLLEVSQLLRHSSIGTVRGRSAVAGGSVVSALCQSVEDHPSIRRALGYKLVDEGRLLMDFVAFVDQSGAVAVTTSA